MLFKKKKKTTCVMYVMDEIYSFVALCNTPPATKKLTMKIIKSEHAGCKNNYSMIVRCVLTHTEEQKIYGLALNV